MINVMLYISGDGTS